VSERLVLDDVAVATWQAFQAGLPAPLAPELATCWTRAKSLGAPRDGAAPEEHLLRGEALRLHAEPIELVRALGDSVLDRATATVAEHDFVLLLADPDGVVVRTSGGGEFADIARNVRLIEGACWSEAARGTNAIGTAAVANRPTEVHGHAHFGRSYHELVCYAAPVRGLDGAPIAVLDATSRIDRATPEIGATIVAAARSLESLLRLQAYANAGRSLTRVLGRSIDRIREPAMWIEAPGVISRANAAARELLQGEGARELAQLGLDWRSLLAEALAPTNAMVELARRSWRIKLEPVAAPHGAIVALLAIFEPALAARASSQSIAIESIDSHADDPFAAIFADDRGVASAIAWSRALATSDLPVMLLAETGAGKELFAHAIHAASPRAAGPFHAVNCGAIAPSLLESELFGYAPGAFTGAERAGRPGLFRAAAGGTLFLDEVAEMSTAMQAALLRVLETGAFRRVGETRLERSDVRVICATCRDLPALVLAGAFRQDLYYRLKGGVVKIPPLRERTDIIALAQHLLGEHAILSPDAADAIARHAWPGNVRELKSTLAVARVVAGADPGWIEKHHLPSEIGDVPDRPSRGAIVDAERDALVRALAQTGGNVSEAARTLGVARSTVQRMKRRFGV
jgi:sigma-54 dependent transcriptional regulator, acetoin dehydrogenase operon transcriptional activator AcoR